VLERGFALVSDPAGHPLTRAAEVAPRASLKLRFADGTVAAIAEGEELSASRPSRARRTEKQGSLL
jgi:exodeoxyribonuclease VII large subunit